MLRTDTKQLNVPDPAALMPEPKREVTKLDLLGGMQRPQEVKPAPLPALTNCPSCNARISSFELKLGSCMSCGKPLAEASTDSAPARVEVHI